MSESMRQSISPRDMTGLLSSLATHQHWYFVHILGKLGGMEVDCFIMFVQNLFMPSTPPSMDAIRKWCLDGFSVLAYQLQGSEELSFLSHCHYHLEKDDVPQYFVHRISDYFNRPSTNMNRVKNTYRIVKIFGIELKIFIAPCHCCSLLLAAAIFGHSRDVQRWVVF